MPDSAQDLEDLQRRVAFTIMCFRFGRDPRTNPPAAEDRVGINLGSDIARSVERQVLTVAANTFLQAQATLPFIWRPAGDLDLYNVATFKEYHALCWLQLEPRLSMAEEVRAALSGARARGRQVAAESPAAAAAEQTPTREEIFAALVRAAGVESETFPERFADLPALGEG